MAIQVMGLSGTVAEVDGTTYRALRVTARPVDYGANGSYRVAVTTGIMSAGLAAGSDIFQARWTLAAPIALIWGIQIDGFGGTSTAFTAGTGSFKAFISRSWTADGSGGTTLTLTGNNNKLRTSMATSQFGAIRISSTAALTTGTKTNDSQAAGQMSFSIGTTASVNYLGQVGLYGSNALEDGGNPAPIVLAQNEGITIQATVPATGTWVAGITMAWSEVSSY